MTNRTETDAQVMMPKSNVFEGKHAIEGSIMTPGYKFPVYDRTEYPPEGGIYVYYKGMPYPRKGFPFPEGIFANDMMKRISLTMIRSIGTKEMLLPILGMAVLPWKIKIRIVNNFLFQYLRISQWIHSACYLKEDRYSNPCRSIRQLVRVFLVEAGIKADIADSAAKVFATIIEYDDAYRYRIEDIFSETSKTALYEQPIREIHRLVKIFIEREQYENVQKTVNAINFMVTIALLHPRIRKAFKKAVSNLTPDQFKWLQLDNADRYHVLLRGDYKFTGRTFEQRKKIFVDFHTHSKCCNGKVREIVNKNSGLITQVCMTCLKDCEFYQDFPPEVEIASYKP